MDRKCSMCLEVKDEKDFRITKKIYFSSYCKNCERIYRLEWGRAYTELNGHSYKYTKKGRRRNGTVVCS